jgi:hypothetical protein
MSRAVISYADPLWREALRACGVNDPKQVREAHLHWVTGEITTLEVHFFPDKEGLEDIVKRYAFVATQLADESTEVSDKPTPEMF